MFMQDIQEEVKLDAMQRHWQLRRGASSSIFEDINETEDILAPPRQVIRTRFKRSAEILC